MNEQIKALYEALQKARGIAMEDCELPELFEELNRAEILLGEISKRHGERTNKK